VKQLKGQMRPLQGGRACTKVLEAFDLVALFEEDVTTKLLTKVRPSVLVKGGDYSREQFVGQEVIEACAGDVLLVDIPAGHSTTSLVDRTRMGKA
jgi:D-beta-D-heptose 7-phosphate kinase/D-beta-D-heptose 1-phosphate adenosyltransferase